MAQHWQTPSDNIYVTDLPSHFTQEACQKVFAAYGTVASCKVMPPRQPGEKSSALVRMGSVEEATGVVQYVNGNIPEGLMEPILVRFANARGGKGGNAGGGKGGQAWGGNAGAAQQGGAQDNIFIGDLPETFTVENCQAVFSQYGEIAQCRVMPSRGPGTGSAMVRFKNPAEAAWVVENLNGNFAEGLEAPIAVRFANQRGQKGGHPARSEPYGGGKGNGKDDNSFYSLYGAVRKAGLLGGMEVSSEQQVFVRNLPIDTTDLDLYKLFGPFGGFASTGVTAMMNQDGSCKGFGFVNFSDPSCAQAAISALNGFQLANGSALGVSIKNSGGKGGGKGFI